LEAGPCQGASGIQRTFGWFRWEIANLASPFQTQLAIDTHMAVGDTQTMVADTKTIVAGTQTVVAGTQTIVADTQTMVADIHRKVLTGQEGTSGKNHSAGVILFIDNGMLTIV
jgi:hypothetical protein